MNVESSRPRPRRRRATWVLLFAVLAGCEEEGPLVTGTLIDGLLLDPDGDPVPGARVGIVYGVSAAAPAAGVLPGTAFAPLQGEAQLGAPYPNPAETALDPPDDIKIPVTVEGPTTIRLEILETRVGVTATVAVLKTGSIGTSQVFSWNARQDLVGPRVPNGLYIVRLTEPDPAGGGGTPVVAEAFLLVNRPAIVMEQEDTFNTLSDFNGRFTLEDLAVGALIDRTSPAGESLGPGRVRHQTTLVIRDPDYQPRNEPVTVGPGEQAEVVIQLTPLAPLRAPAGP